MVRVLLGVASALCEDRRKVACYDNSHLNKDSSLTIVQSMS
jgi:hypothetical protein